MRLIDAEPLVAISWKAHKDETYEQGFEDGVCHALDRIEQAPTIDAVQVVRCRDCEYCHPIFCAPDGSPACDGSFSCGDTDIDYYAPSYHMDTYFCASGKRRNEDVSKD